MEFTQFLTVQENHQAVSTWNLHSSDAHLSTNTYTENNNNNIHNQHFTENEQFLFDMDIDDFNLFDLGIDNELNLSDYSNVTSLPCGQVAVSDGDKTYNNSLFKMANTEVKVIDDREEEDSLFDFVDSLLTDELFGQDNFGELFQANPVLDVDENNSTTFLQNVFNQDISTMSSENDSSVSLSCFKRKRESIDEAFDETQTGESTDESVSESKIGEIPKRQRRSQQSESKEKKQSNKEAAIRYRQKKSKEKESLYQERDKYELENIELKKQIENVQTEINFVKNILVEMLLKKNILNNVNLSI